jgi:hypothetical protein
MKKSPISIARNDALILALARGENLADALRHAGLSPGRALQVLRSQETRRQLQCLRRLLACQKRLILRAAVPDALAAVLRSLRDDQKPELQLKAAQSILQFALPKPPRRLPKPPSPPPETPWQDFYKLPPGVTEEEVRAAMAASAES